MFESGSENALANAAHGGVGARVCVCVYTDRNCRLHSAYTQRTINAAVSVALLAWHAIPFAATITLTQATTRSHTVLLNFMAIQP